MKVLHITNNYPTLKLPIFGIFVKEQIESLSKHDIINDIFFINGRENGKLEYIKSIFRLRKKLKKNDYDIIHCHHVLSGIILILTRNFRNSKIVVSFQNDPTNELGQWIYKYVRKNSHARIFKNKSEFLLNDPNSFYLPNGVNINFFKPINKEIACQELNLSPEYIYIMFVSSNYVRTQKRYDRFQQVIKILKEKYNYNNIKELKLVNEQRNKIPFYFNTADVHLLSSDFEGSPNSVKECMACNTSVVSTNVGNVRELLRDVNGSFVSKSFNEDELAELVHKSMQISVKNSREQLIKLNLDLESVANELKSIYINIINNK